MSAQVAQSSQSRVVEAGDRHQDEQLLLESASRAKEKTEQRKTQAKDGHDGDAPTLHKQMSHSTSYRKDGADKGARSTQTAVAVGRTESGTEIDLETGLPREESKSFSWFYAICFVVLVVILVYASVIILQRYT